MADREERISLSQLAYQLLSWLIGSSVGLSAYQLLNWLLSLSQLLNFTPTEPTVKCIINTFNNPDEVSCHITLGKHDT